MKTIKHIISRYFVFLWALLKPLGAWGVFAIAGIDACFFGLPLDGVVAGYVYQDRSRFLEALETAVQAIKRQKRLT